ncbi:protein kinase C-binding protein 1 isoform X2 [Thrips palmi]|uniref:Protein kinase C-binding protein 1 isoform X2 n=1 Tax=Thrips palmi TaxID=161013 RepID=A0A6P8YDU8_THRPL|nr:protein kinase C-binding protein 1 isoform X2 [Thrips palmi]
MDNLAPICGEGVMNLETDDGPPTLQCQSEASGRNESDTSDPDNTQKDTNVNSAAPVLSVMKLPDLDPENALRSPPKLLPAVVTGKSKSDEPKSPVKPLTGSMKNTPASLSIIETPGLNVGKSTRSTRSSIDPSFAAKQRSFLNKVHNALSSTHYNDIDDTSSCGSDHDIIADNYVSDDKSPEYVPGLEEIPKKLLNGMKRRREESLNKSKPVTGVAPDHSASSDPPNDVVNEPSPKKWAPATVLDGKLRDAYCWYCHRENTELFCASCPRGFHSRCLRKPLSSNPEEEWVCIECVTILRAENQETRSKALKMLSLDQLCKLLLYAVNRMKSCAGAEVFENAVDHDEFPLYKDHIINPMYLSLLEKNIKKKMYGSTEAFIGDATWLLHNCIIFNSFHSKLTSVAKSIMKLCKQEMAEIENCPDCYFFAYTEDENWFIQVCQKPHLLVWAKLKGFPYWPAKVIRSNADSLDVRFFGAHDRAWVPARDCYLYSRENPNLNNPAKLSPGNVSQKKKSSKNNLDTCIEEVEQHIKLLKKRFTTFQYAYHRTHVNLKKLDDHLKFLLPDLSVPDANNSNVSVRTSKTPLSKHGSFELESATSGPSIKRMKADSSSGQSTTSVVNSSDANDPAENVDVKDNRVSKALKALKETHVTSTPVKGVIASPAAANSFTESSAAVCMENGALTPKENGTSASQSKIIGDSKTVSQHTVTPGHSSSFVSPLSSSEATSIAELRLKKKDIRKIGLVDRLQEKLNNMLQNQSSNTQEDELKSQLNELETVSNEENVGLGKVEKASTSTPNQECTENTLESDDEMSSPERKALLNEAVKNILDSFKMIENQPKVVLTKLNYDFINKPTIKSEPSPDNDESLSSENKDSDILPGQTSDKTKETTPDTNIKEECVEDCIEEPVVSRSANHPKPVEELSISSVAVPKSLKSNVRSGELNVAMGDAKLKPVAGLVVENPENIVKKKKPKSKAVSVTLVTSNGNGNVTESPVDFESIKASSESTLKSNENTSSTVPNTILKVGQNDSTVTSNNEETSGTVPKVLLKVAHNADVETSGVSAPQVSKVAFQFNSSMKTVKVPCASLVPNKPETIRVPTKFITKPICIRPKPQPEIPEQKKSQGNKLIVNDRMILIKTDNTPVLGTSNSSPNNSGKEPSAKSQLPSNATVRLEPSKRLSSDEAKSDSENPLVIVTSPEPDAPCTKSMAKTTDVTKRKGQTQSPPKPASPGIGLTPIRQLAKSSPTSLLKPRSSPPIVETSDTREINVHVTASEIIASLSNAGISKIDSQHTTNAISSVPRTPTFVTVSGGTGRRLLPKAVPLVVRSPTTSTSASPPSGNTISISPKITVSPLVTSVTTAVPPLVSGTLTMESVLKKSQINTVPKLTAAPSLLNRGMPPLSIANVPGLKSPATTTNARCRFITQPTSSGTCMPTSECLSSMCVGEKPVSRELHNQSQKMSQMFLEWMKDFLGDMASSGSLEAQVRSLQHDMELMQWRHQQELAELRHNTELAIAEVRDHMRIESERAVYQAVANAAKEKEAAVAAAKEKQWCAFCKKEALFYCCWNTSYCDYQCQQNHWRVHSLTCTQNSSYHAEHSPSSSGDNIQTERGTPSRMSN